MLKETYNKIKKLYLKYERWLMPTSLVFGVIVDTITFANIKITTTFITLGIHILFVGSVIAFFNIYKLGKNKTLDFLYLITPIIIQFSFGALLSASFIFYFFSGSIYVSWPLILLIVILMISNDIFRKYYSRPIIQILIYYFLLFSIIAIITPFILQRLGVWVFLLSGILSLLIITIYLKILEKYTNLRLKKFINPIVAIFIFINILYFLNIIPPIPLTLKDSIVGHGITRSNNNYIITVEKESWLAKIIPGYTIYKAPGEVISVYTAIFAPGDLHTKIYHNWQYKENGKWISYGKFSYIISGGRKDGYRGYSLKSNLNPGKWRINIETSRGQVLGRVNFKIIHSEMKPPLIKIKK